MFVQESLGSVAPPTPAVTPPGRPPEARALFGREEDLARVAAAVEAGERLVTVLGPPGIGKTSLAVRAAERLGPRFGGAGRVLFVDLSTAHREADLCLAVLSSLGARGPEISAATPANVAALLEVRGRALVVLDNFEQIVSAAGLVPAWLAAAPEAVVVVTSRERLAVDGERVVELSPLGCPRRGATRDEVLASEAVQLFRARAADAGARPSDDLEAVADVVRQLDGIPLAIELAAARTRLLSPAELAARLGRGEAVLSAAAKRSHERHRTLSHAIAWSWDLLTHDEQLALGSCAVFPASFSVASAEALVDAALAITPLRRGSVPSPVDLVAALREKSLVHAAEDGRLALYLSIREFAAKKLAEQGIDGAVRIAHAQALADLARRFNASRLLQGAIPEPSLHAAVRREKADLCAALAHVSTLPPLLRAPLRAELSAAVAFLCAVPAEIAEREISLALADEESLGPREIAILRIARQGVLRLLGRFEEAIAETPRVVAIPGVPVGLACFALANAGVTLRARGEARAAWDYHERAARLLEGETSLPRLAGMNTACMGRLECDLSHPDAARALNARAVELCDALGDRWLAGLGLANLAQLEQEERSFERAEDLLTRALARFRETGEPQYEAIYAAICGGLYFEWGKLDLARSSYAAGEAALPALTLPFACVLVHGGRAALEALTGHPAEAAAHLDLARRHAARAPDAVARLVVEAHEGTVEIARAPSEAPRWRRRVEELTRGDSEDAVFLRSNIDVRFAVRVLSRALSTLCPPPGGVVLRAAPGALRFSIDGGPPIDLARRGPLRRILAALCEERLAHPGKPLPIETLTARGWPNERILVEAASTRVRVAIATLRKLGLRRVLLTRDDGYLLDPEVRVEPL